MILFKAREKGLEFILDADPDLPDRLFGDEVRVREILTNILNNAVKYTNRGYVRLKVRARDRAGSAVRLVFIVEDSGIGIRKEDMPYLFRSYGRLDRQANRHIESTGLGLGLRPGIALGRNGRHEIGILPYIAFAYGIAAEGRLLLALGSTTVGSIGSRHTILDEHDVGTGQIHCLYLC